MWDRPEPPALPAPVPLSRDAIVQAAITLADADGLAAVSLRKVAAELTAGPMRLYRYISTKEELLDLMVDAVYGEIPLVGPDLDWRAALTSIAHGVRAAVLRHEWLADLFGGRPNQGPHALAHLEASLAAVAGDIEDIDTVLQAVAAVNRYVVGAVKAELANRRVEQASGLTTRQWQRTVGPYLHRQIATGRFPTLARVMAEAADPSPDETFEIGLTYVLDGIATQVVR